MHITYAPQDEHQRWVYNFQLHKYQMKRKWGEDGWGASVKWQLNEQIFQTCFLLKWSHKLYRKQCKRLLIQGIFCTCKSYRSPSCFKSSAPARFLKLTSTPLSEGPKNPELNNKRNKENNPLKLQKECMLPKNELPHITLIVRQLGPWRHLNKFTTSTKLTTNKSITLGELLSFPFIVFLQWTGTKRKSRIIYANDI